MAQVAIIWLIPLFGSSFVLRLAFDHSPEAIPKQWIPWPLKRLIYGKPNMPNKNRDENELDTYPSRGIHQEHIGGGSSCGEGGAGGD